MSILNTITNTRSSITFSTAENIRKYSGRLESPTARSIAEPILYINSPDMPAKYMVK